jgi:hypothetical protein
MVNGLNGFVNSGTINEWFEDTRKEVQSILNDKDENGEILYKRIAESDNFIYSSLSCFYGLTENYYNLSASPWIPAVSGAVFKIQTGNINGDVVFDILPTV